MQVLRWSAAAAFAAMVGLAPAGAGDDLSAIKASMDNMKIEMEAMRSQLAAEREAFRANAGGAPEALTSAKGNATIRIGGDVRVQYQLGTGNGYRRSGYVAWDEAGHRDPNMDSNIRSAKAGWNVARAGLDFDIDLSCDTKAFIGLRFDEGGTWGSTQILDQAYWQWNNVGGSGFGLKIGLMDMPFGMWANTDMGGYDFDGVDRPLITDPFVRNIGNLGFVNAADGGMGLEMLNSANNRAVTNLGLLTSYNWDDQVVLKAGIMAGGVNNLTLSGRPDGPDQLTYDNEIRNIGFVDHVFALGWNPCWIDGLHLEASYLGTYDSGMRGQYDKLNGSFVNNNPYRHNYPQSIHGDSFYRPSFDLGASYKINDRWKAYAEACMTWNPYYGDGYSLAMTAGVDYSVTDKLMLGAGFDWAHFNYTGDTLMFGNETDGYDNLLDAMNGSKNANLYRINVGAKYDFGNGLYFQAQYYHDMCYASGFRDQKLKDADTILFQTGYQF